MREGFSIKKWVFTPMALVMAAVICFCAVPFSHVTAASSVTVKLTKSGTKKNVSLKKGGSCQITAKNGSKTLGKSAVKYSTSKSSVASVSSTGMISAKGTGTAKITVKKGAKKAVITVKVTGSSNNNSGDDKDFERIFLNASELNIKLGATSEALVCKTYPGRKTVSPKWSIDDESIATVSDGKVTGKEVGTTILWANYEGKVTACTIKVYK